MTEIQHGTTESTASVEGGRGDRKTREGLVVSDKMDKTVVVAVEDRVQPAVVVELTGRDLEAEVEQLLLGLPQAGEQLVVGEVAHLGDTSRHH